MVDHRIPQRTEIYLSVMAGLLKLDYTRLKETYKKILEAEEKALQQIETGQSDFSFREIKMHHEIPEITMNKISVELFYPSFFISLFVDLEKSLLTLCEELPRPIERLSVRNIAGKGIVRSKDYLVKVININFGTIQSWPKIIKFGELRNNLVHQDGKEPLLKKDGKLVFLQQGKDEDEKRLLEWHEEGQIIGFVNIDEEFCWNAINVIGNFWVSLFKEISNNFEI